MVTKVIIEPVQSEVYENCEKVTKRGMHWKATHNEDVLVESHTDPEHAAARALLARGITGRMEIWHRGAPHAATVWNIEAAAKECAFDSDHRGPMHGKWKPHPRDEME